MARAWIRKRTLKRGGSSHQVLYRRGGRMFRIETAGTFPARKHAQTRRELVQGWLAAGLDPKAELARIESPPPRRTFRQVARAWLESRADVSEGSKRSYGFHVTTLEATFGNLSVEEITAEDVTAWIAACGYSPATVRAYLGTLRLIFDFAKVTPNPAREREVRLPRQPREQIVPPSATELDTILANIAKRLRLPLVTAEQAAMRIGEVQKLAWGDVDEQSYRFLLHGTKGDKARWAQVPAWLMAVIAETCPREDRTRERKVFPAFSPEAARAAMGRACKAAGIRHYHPHDLRHRRISLWHGQSVPLANIAERAGHSRASFTLDVYTHVMPSDELPVERYLELLGADERRSGDDAVMTQAAEIAAIPVVEREAA